MSDIAAAPVALIEGVGSSTRLQKAITELNQAMEVPQCVKTVIEEMAMQLGNLIKENSKLRQENARIPLLLRENTELREKISHLEGRLKTLPAHSLISAHNDHSEHESDPCHEFERLRSVVIGRIPESRDRVMKNRLDHDFFQVMNILSFLQIECYPRGIYRLGRPIPGGSRLLKVVLPSTYFQKLAVRRASWLRSYPVRGAFLRESLIRAELERRKENGTFCRSWSMAQEGDGLPIQGRGDHLPACDDARTDTKCTGVPLN